MLNIFLNSYSQPENKLTYNFLWIIQYLNCNKFIDVLLNNSFESNINPILSISTVFGGGDTNPDGSLTIEKKDNENVTVYLEVKTYRRGIDIKQLKGHLKFCRNSDYLLVITPRKSDFEVVSSLCDKRIIFQTWHSISDFLHLEYKANVLVREFVEYGYKSGEFENMGEIDKKEIEVIASFYRTRFKSRISTMINEVDYNSHFAKYKLNFSHSDYGNHWGREGRELYFNKPKFGIWSFYGIYYDESNHRIDFKMKDLPEIVFFIDIDPDEAKIKIDRNTITQKELSGLLKNGFEINIEGRLTPNRSRFITYRKPIVDFNEISVKSLEKNLDEILAFVSQNHELVSMING